MSFATVIAAAVSVLQKHADFDTSNCLHGDMRPIATGAARVVSMTYGGLATEEFSLQRLMHRWMINVDLLIPWPGEQSTFEANLSTERQKVIDTFASWPALDGTSGVLRALLTVGQEPELVSEGAGAYRGQRMLLEVDEVVDPSRSE